MRKRRMLLAGLLTAALAVTSLAGCGGSDSKTSKGGEKKGGEQVLNYSNNSVVTGMNPILNTTAPDNAAYYMMMEPLVKYRSAKDNTTEIVPGCAAKWETSEDGLTWTFHFQKDIKWSDGQPLKAGDFVYTLQLMADPKVAATNAWLFDGVIENFGDVLYNKGKKAEDIGAKAPDDSTLVLKLVHPASYLPQLLSSLYPVRQDKYEQWGSEYGTAVDKTLYSGAFVPKSWSQNTEMVLEKNKNYWNAGNVKLDKINYKVIQETATAVQAFISGEIDWVGTSDPNWAKTIEAKGDSKKYVVPSGAPDWLMFNCSNEYLKNTKIRQALSIAFDRKKFVDDLRDGEAFPNYSMIPDTMTIGDTPYTKLVDGKNYFIKDMQKEYTDPKKLFQEGLKELGKSTDTSQVTLNYASRGTSELSKKIGEWFKQTWEEKLGIKVNIDMMEWNIMWDKIDAGQYDIAQGGWGPYYNEPSALLSLYHPVSGYFNSSKSGWKDEDSKKFGEILDKSAQVVDAKEKAGMYLEAEKLLVQNAVLAPIYQEGSPYYVAKYVKGMYVGTSGCIDFSEISVDK